ncbi:MAG: hypothetical protein ACM3ZO_02865 [Clostridia bacterium]
MNEAQANSTITLRLATRDDRWVVWVIHERQEIDSLHTLDSAGLLDGLLVFVNDIGFMGALKRFNIMGYERMILPLVHFILTSMTKILLDITSMNALPEILFADCAAMELLGFNAQVLEDGICIRGHHSRKAGQKKPTPFSPQTVANVLARFSLEEAEALLDTLISLIARNAILDEELSVIIDATDLIVPDSFPEDTCGAATYAALWVRTVIAYRRLILVSSLGHFRDLLQPQPRQHARQSRAKEVIVRLLPCNLLPVETPS